MVKELIYDAVPSDYRGMKKMFTVNVDMETYLNIKQQFGSMNKFIEFASNRLGVNDGQRNQKGRYYGIR